MILHIPPPLKLVWSLFPTANHRHHAPHTALKTHHAPKMRAALPRAGLCTEPSYFVEVTAGAVTLEVDLPGVAREHVKLDIGRRRLVILGNRFRAPSHAPPDPTASAPAQLDVEGSPLPFVQYVLELPLARNTDHCKTTAEYHGDGTLTVQIPFLEGDSSSPFLPKS